MEDKFIDTNDDVLAMLDALLASRERDWWNGFYEDRAKPCPFFAESPDESLVHWFNEGLLRPGKALDLGCGNGRNAIFLARQGYAVDGVDYSGKAIDWATERARDADVTLQLHCQSVFDFEFAADTYDLIYDSGCFHHLPPHRRRTYVELVTTALKSGGMFGLACFRPEGGSGLSDYEVYERRTLGGGLGYTQDRLRDIWSNALQVRNIRPMQKQRAESELFGAGFLWVMLAQKQVGLRA